MEARYDCAGKETGGVVILDLGDCVSDLFQILDRCSQICVPVRNDVISQAKLAQLEQLLKSWDYLSVCERMQKIKLSLFTAPTELAQDILRNWYGVNLVIM